MLEPLSYWLKAWEYDVTENEATWIALGLILLTGRMGTIHNTIIQRLFLQPGICIVPQTNRIGQVGDFSVFFLEQIAKTGL